MKRLPSVIGLPCVAVLLLGTTAHAAEVWGRVTTYDARHKKVTISHKGDYKTASFRLGPDTEFRYPDGVVRWRVDVRRLIGKPVFATVEDVAGQYARKIWIMPEPPNASDPVIRVGKP